MEGLRRSAGNMKKSVMVMISVLILSPLSKTAPNFEILQKESFPCDGVSLSQKCMNTQFLYRSSIWLIPLQFYFFFQYISVPITVVGWDRIGFMGPCWDWDNLSMGANGEHISLSMVTQSKLLSLIQCLAYLTITNEIWYSLRFGRPKPPLSFREHTLLILILGFFPSHKNS